MNVIDLPIVDSQSSTLSALRVMVQSGRTAVFVATGNGHALLSAHDALEAHRGVPKRGLTLANLALPPFMLDMTSVASPAGWRGPDQLRQKLMMSILKDSGAVSALVGIEPGKRGWLLTKHKDLARQLGLALVLCSCPIDPNDIFQPAEVDASRECPNHPGAILNCTSDR